MQSWPEPPPFPPDPSPELVNPDSPCYDYRVIEHDPTTKDEAMSADTMTKPKGKKDKSKAKPAKVSDRADVTAVLASVDQGEALRDRIKALQAELKIHEDNIKDVLGEATTGVDGRGNVVVRYPFRNRSGLSKEKVKAKLSAKDYAECESVTEYRTLLYGEG